MFDLGYDGRVAQQLVFYLQVNVPGLIFRYLQKLVQPQRARLIA